MACAPRAVSYGISWRHGGGGGEIDESNAGIGRSDADKLARLFAAEHWQSKKWHQSNTFLSTRNRRAGSIKYAAENRHHWLADAFGKKAIKAK